MRWILPLFILVSAQTVYGWGPQGHMIVAQVAENNLTPAAKKAVSKLLNNQGLPVVASWADQVKGDAEWSHTKDWHFVDIPDGHDYSSAAHNHNGDAVTAITEMVKILKDPKAKPIEKTAALKFIVHFVGDIHQPLHVGRPEDRGGNSTRVVFEGRETNLHALWDTQLIMKSPMNYTQYASSLEPKSLFMAAYDLPEFSFSTVIHECMEARDDIYNFGRSAGAPVTIDSGYYKRNLALLNQHLLMGGKRLAEILNKVFK